MGVARNPGDKAGRLHWPPRLGHALHSNYREPVFTLGLRLPSFDRPFLLFSFFLLRVFKNFEQF